VDKRLLIVEECCFRTRVEIRGQFDVDELREMVVDLL